jgi:hypothetical protein
MPVASIDVWNDPFTVRTCRVQVYDDACDVEIYAGDRRLLTVACTSLPAAIEQANLWRPSVLKLHTRES